MSKFSSKFNYDEVESRVQSIRDRCRQLRAEWHEQELQKFSLPVPGVQKRGERTRKPNILPKKSENFSSTSRSENNADLFFDEWMQTQHEEQLIKNIRREKMAQAKRRRHPDKGCRIVLRSQMLPPHLAKLQIHKIHVIPEEITTPPHSPQQSRSRSKEPVENNAVPTYHSIDILQAPASNACAHNVPVSSQISSSDGENPAKIESLIAGQTKPPGSSLLLERLAQLRDRQIARKTSANTSRVACGMWQFFERRVPEQSNLSQHLEKSNSCLDGHGKGDCDQSAAEFTLKNVTSASHPGLRCGEETAEDLPSNFPLDISVIDQEYTESIQNDQSIAELTKPLELSSLSSKRSNQHTTISDEAILSLVVDMVTSSKDTPLGALGTPSVPPSAVSSEEPDPVNIIVTPVLVQTISNDIEAVVQVRIAITDAHPPTVLYPVMASPASHVVPNLTNDESISVTYSKLSVSVSPPAQQSASRLRPSKYSPNMDASQIRRSSSSLAALPYKIVHVERLEMDRLEEMPYDSGMEIDQMSIAESDLSDESAQVMEPVSSCKASGDVIKLICLIEDDSLFLLIQPVDQAVAVIKPSREAFRSLSPPESIASSRSSGRISIAELDVNGLATSEDDSSEAAESEDNGDVLPLVLPFRMFTMYDSDNESVSSGEIRLQKDHDDLSDGEIRATSTRSRARFHEESNSESYSD